MNLIRINNQVIDLDICNEKTMEKNKQFIAMNGFDPDFPENERRMRVEKLKLIFHVDIDSIFEYTNIHSVKVLIFHRRGGRPTYLGFYDINGNEIDKRISVRCQKCGREFTVQRGHLMRRTHLLCKQCTYSFAQLNGGMKKFEETMIKKYGCRRPINNPSIKQKIQNTMQKKYGANSPLESQIVQKKIAATMIERYGVDNPFCCKEFQYKAKKGYINHSIKGDELMEHLSKDLPFRLLYGDDEKLFSFHDHWYRVDGYVEELSTAIEFQGDYYHANPELYSADHVFNIWGKTYTSKQIWDKDAKRKQELEDVYHIKIVYVWEKELDDYGYEFVLNKIKQELGI